MGHVAVITVDPDDRSTRYIEYGRYNSPGRGSFVGYHANGLGNYVRHTIPDKKEGEEDWQYINRIKKSLPHGSKFQAMLIPEVDTSKMWKYIENTSNNKDRPKYTANPIHFNPNGALMLSPQTCATEANRIIRNGLDFSDEIREVFTAEEPLRGEPLLQFFNPWSPGAFFKDLSDLSEGGVQYFH